MGRYPVAVIGGGASGIVAAISAKRHGASVVLCEKTTRLGRKILASGGGRCNLANECLDESFYNPEARNIVRSVFKRFGKKEVLDFFGEISLKIYPEEGRIFPVTNQASSVLGVLEAELKRSAVPVELDFEVTGIAADGNGFAVTGKGNKRIDCDKVIIACGGKSYPSFGADGKAYQFAKAFGHTIIEAVPSAVPLVVKDRLCHLLQGQKIMARAKSVIDGRITGEASGDLLFTKYGLSGTAIIDVSEPISIAINRQKKKDAAVIIDMVPFMDCKELETELSKRHSLMGILPNKFDMAFKDRLAGSGMNSLVKELKAKHFTVLGTRGWNEAEFTAGGIDTSELKEGTLESKLKRGFYFAGEILNVNGKRGGYNLAWAWASGSVAGSML